MYAAECTGEELATVQFKLSQIFPECDVDNVDVEAYCAHEGCYTKMKEFNRTLPDCESNGQNLKEGSTK